MKLKVVDVILTVLLIIGGLNWGLVGLFNFDLVAAIFGDATLLSRIVYTLVGVAALYEIIMLRSMVHRWSEPAHKQQPQTP